MLATIAIGISCFSMGWTCSEVARYFIEKKTNQS